MENVRYMSSKAPRTFSIHANSREPDPADTVSVKRRIFIIDDHAMFRDVLRRLIDLEPELIVCGDASDAADGLKGIRESPPDLVIVDISLDTTSGLDLIKAIKRDYEDLPVLVVSMHSDSLYGDRALRAGAMGYVMKSEPATTVVAAIRKVLNGNVHISDTMATLVVTRFVKGDPDQVPSPLAAR
jgi:DNA-binding NarL/FixJ family response regulator